MKNLLRISLLTILFSLMISSLVVYGEENQSSFSIDVEEPIMITVQWEIGDIDVAFETPSGTVISPTEIPDGVILLDEEMAYRFIILQPQVGQWGITYDKKLNESINLAVDPYTLFADPMWITEFSVGQVYNEKYVDVSFFVDGNETNTRYDYEVSIAIEGDEVISKTLNSGSGYSDKAYEKSINLSDVNSYDSYVITLKIIYEQEGYEMYDFEESEVFSFENVSNENPVESFEVLLDDEGLGQIILEPVDIYSVDGYVVNVFEDGGLEPVDIINIDDDDSSCYFVYDPSATSLTIEVMTEDNGILSAPNTKEINLAEIMASSVSFLWPEGDATNQAELMLTYENGGNQQIVVILNGIQNTLTLEESGEIKLSLEEGNNTINIHAVTDDFVCYPIEKMLICDTYPPQLFVYEDVNEITTNKETITLLGNVEQSATLTCNGNPVAVDEEGEYIYELVIRSGENGVELVATDPVGNRTKYVATISKGQVNNEKVMALLPLFIGIVVVIFLILIYAIVGAKKNNNKEKK